MNAPVLWLVLLTALPLGAAERPAYLGSISEIHGTVELRETPGGSPTVLHPERDRYRPLFAGNALRCAPESWVQVMRPFGRATNITRREWVELLPDAMPSGPSRVQTYHENTTVGAGRSRGVRSVQRALLVGVDPQGGGSVHDVLALRSLLVTHFDFAAESVLVLTNEQASRERILSAFQRHLLEPAQPGDVALFLRAGPASQLPHSLSPESDRMNEPAEQRDQQLQRLLNAAADRGAIVTAIRLLGSPGTSAEFPYRLALRNSTTGAVRSDGALVETESYGLALVASPHHLEAEVEKRFAYVCVIDAAGRSQLLYPGPSRDEGRLPAGTDKPPVIALGPRKLFTVSPPFGVDTYVLLTSAEPLPDPQALSFHGAQGGVPSTGQSALARLIATLQQGTRGATRTASWSIETLSLRSVPAR